MSVPQEFLCPLSKEIMTDPVSDMFGNTYERVPILEYVSVYHRTPIGNLPLEADELHDNSHLKSRIQEYLRTQLTHDVKVTDTRARVPEYETPASNSIYASDSFSDLSNTKFTSYTDTNTYKQESSIYQQSYETKPKQSYETKPKQSFASATKHFDSQDLTTEAFILLPENHDELTGQTTDVSVCLRISPPVNGTRTPSNICCVVDVSRSMDDAADVKGEGGQSLTLVHSILDIVKHSVNTIIGLLEPGDTFSLVTFSDVGRVVLRPTGMDAIGKAQAARAVSSLTVENTTNLWDGLKKGLELAMAENHSQQLHHVIVLTDGVPNVNPPSGELESLRALKRSRPELSNCTVNTFGFGYELDSSLLRSLATENFGQYVFIPDITLVGTTFVHAISNILSTHAVNVTLTLDIVDSNVRIMKNGRQKTLNINVGSALYGQKRDVFATLKLPANASHELITVRTSYLTRMSKTAQTSVLTVSKENILRRPLTLRLEIEASKLRDEFGRMIANVLERHQSAPLEEIVRTVVSPYIAKLSEFKTRVEDILEHEDDDDGVISKIRLSVAEGLIKDAQGEVCLALSDQKSKNRWGIHYLPSLALAHGMQIRNNFKDPGVQFYGGELFEELVKRGDQVFTSIELPPPTKRLRDTTVVTNRVVVATPAYAPPQYNPIPDRMVSIRDYYDRNNPCFSGDSLVCLFDGTTKRADHIEKGDRVAVGANSGLYATIQCVVETVIPEGQAVAFVTLNQSRDIRVTPYHPILVDQCWTFPIDHPAAQTQIDVNCRSVFSFVLDSHHTIVVGGVPAACFGHGLTDNSVIEHEYFGTQRVVDDLKQMKGWDEGHVRISGVKRCERTNRICGLTA